MPANCTHHGWALAFMLLVSLLCLTVNASSDEPPANSAAPKAPDIAATPDTTADFSTTSASDTTADPSTPGASDPTPSPSEMSFVDYLLVGPKAVLSGIWWVIKTILKLTFMILAGLVAVLVACGGLGGTICVLLKKIGV